MVLPDGTTSFQALQNALRGSGTGAARLLRLRPRCTSTATTSPRAPLEERKDAAGAAPDGRADGRTLRYSDHVAATGAAFFEQACRLGLEGHRHQARATRPTSAAAAAAWLKVKCLQRQEFVIGGYTDPEGARAGIGALLLGVHDERARSTSRARSAPASPTKTLRGPASSGSTPLEQTTSPFAAARIPGVTRAHWVRAGAGGRGRSSREWTTDGRLRHPSFQGLREDKSRAEVVRERPPARSEQAAPAEAPATQPAGGRSARAEEAEVAGVRLTHPDRVLYPDQGITKLRPRPLLRAHRRPDPAPPRGPPAHAGALPGGRGEADCFYRSTPASGRRTRCAA